MYKEQKLILENIRNTYLSQSVFDKRQSSQRVELQPQCELHVRESMMQKDNVVYFDFENNENSINNYARKNSGECYRQQSSCTVGKTRHGYNLKNRSVDNSPPPEIKWCHDKKSYNWER